MNARRHLGTLVASLAIGASLLGAHSASAQTLTHHTRAISYQFKSVSNPNDPTFTQLLGINDHGAIAGYYGSGQIVSGTLHPNKGFTLTLPDNFTPENFPNSAQTQVVAINNHSDTGGFYVDQAGNTHGFLNHNGTFTNADLPGTTFNQILGLNNYGQAAGYFQDAQMLNHAYIRDARGTYVVPAIPNSQATSINDLGEVVGFTQPTTTTSSAFIWQNNAVRIVSYPGATFTQALGVNDKGQIVGTYNDAQGNAHGFLYDKGRFQAINVPGASSTVINGINNKGAIVGFFVDGDGNTVGAVGKPMS